MKQSHRGKQGRNLDAGWVEEKKKNKNWDLVKQNSWKSDQMIDWIDMVWSGEAAQTTSAAEVSVLFACMRLAFSSRGTRQRARYNWPEAKIDIDTERGIQLGLTPHTGI